MSQTRADVAVVGGGILGLAHAYQAAKAGRRVVLFERSPRAMGASIRNFGMLWPMGQPAGRMHQMAMTSRAHWLDVIAAARLPHYPTGSLHVVYREDEATVAQEFAALAPAQALRSPGLTRSRCSPAARPWCRRGCSAACGRPPRSSSIRG
ncbi:MAG: FAD-dependent oxidoreductase [Acidobacteriota bacterium]